MLGRYSRSQPFFCLFIQNGCEGRSKDKERQKPIKPGEGRGQTTFVVWSIWFLVRVVEKGAFARKEKFQVGKKCEAESWNDMEIIPPPREFVGRLFVCFFFSEPLQLPYGRGRGPGIHTKTSRWGWNKCANARPRDNSKIAFYCHLWLRPKLQQCYQILFEGDVYLKCILLARNVVFKIGWIDFFILWKKGWDK